MWLYTKRSFLYFEDFLRAAMTAAVYDRNQFLDVIRPNSMVPNSNNVFFSLILVAGLFLPILRTNCKLIYLNEIKIRTIQNAFFWNFKLFRITGFKHSSNMLVKTVRILVVSFLCLIFFSRPFYSLKIPQLVKCSLRCLINFSVFLSTAFRPIHVG